MVNNLLKEELETLQKVNKNLIKLDLDHNKTYLKCYRLFEKRIKYLIDCKGVSFDNGRFNKTAF